MTTSADPEHFHYRHSGLAIRSDVELPEWAGFAAEPDADDVRIAVVPALPGRSEAAETRFTIAGVGDYLVRGGCEILVMPHAHAPEAHWRLFLLGSAWGALGYQRGLAMWHGSAVARGGRAVLLCGDNGAGKSTLAAALVARGAVLVSDDLSRIDPAQGAASIHPASARLKLWGEMVDHLGWQGRVEARDWLREDKFHCAVPENHAPGPPLPLQAIVVLAEGEDERLEPLEGAAALEAVLRATIYRPGTIEELGQWPRQGALAAQILAGTRAFRLVRPRDLARLEESAKLVEGLWQAG